MHALTAVAAAGRGSSTASATGLRRSLTQHLLKKRSLLMGGGGGGGGGAVLLPTSHGFHSSAPALGGGTPGEWNHGKCSCGGGVAGWCGFVEMELWIGEGGDVVEEAGRRERRRTRSYFLNLIDSSQPAS